MGRIDIHSFAEEVRAEGASVLYPIVNLEDHDADDLTRLIGDLAAGAVRIVQGRHKRAMDAQGRSRLERMAELCLEYGMLLIVNDDAGLAAEVGAGGAHLGRDDMPLKRALELMPGAMLGKTCRSLEHCREALNEGAGYAALGAMFPSFSKPTAPHIGPQKLKEAREGLGSGPLLVAIGGIDEYNFRGILNAGADLIAAVTLVLDPVRRMDVLKAFVRPRGGFR